MLSNKVALGLIAVVALGGAAGTGVYLASHQAHVVTTANAVTPPSTTPAAGGAVEATEAVMDDKDGAKDGAAKPAEAATPSAAPAATPPAAPAVTPPPTRAPKAPAASGKPRHSESVPIASAAKPPAPAKAPATPTQTHAPATVADSRSSVPAQPAAPPSTASPSTQAHPADPDSTSARAEHPADPVKEEPPAPQFLEVTVPSDSVIGLQFDTSLSSESAHVEDRVVAHVTRDVHADGRIAIPAGSKVIGSVSLVDRGGRVKEQARLGVRFHTIILADGTELPLQTETIYREGESPTNASAAKVGGGAIGGAILGAILGGGKGAAIGGAIGAAGGSAAVMAGGPKPAKIAAGSPVTVKVLSPVTVTVERE
jgi:type IV secretory pathway VirB10-like protein